MNLLLKSDLCSQPDHLFAVFQRIPENRGFLLWTDPGVTSEDQQALAQFFHRVRRVIAADGCAGIRQVRFREGMPRLSELHREGSVLDISRAVLRRPAVAAEFVVPHEVRRALLDLPDEPASEAVLVGYDCLAFDQLAAGREMAAKGLIRELAELEVDDGHGQLMVSLLRQLADEVRQKKRVLSPTEFYKLALVYLQSAPHLKDYTRRILAAGDDVEDLRNRFTATMKHCQFDVLPDAPARDAYLIHDEDSFRSHGSALAAFIASNHLRVATREQNSTPVGDEALGQVDAVDRLITIPILPEGVAGHWDPDWHFAAVIVQRTRYLLECEPALLQGFLAQTRSGSPRATAADHLLELARRPWPASSTREGSSAVFATVLPPMHDPAWTLAELICRINHIRCLAGALPAFQQVHKACVAEDLAVPRPIALRLGRLAKVLTSPAGHEALARAEQAAAFLTGADPKLAAALRHPFWATLRVVERIKDASLDTMFGRAVSLRRRGW